MTAKKEIIEVLRGRGDAFHGGREEEIAQEWIECGFSPRGVERWTAIGVWSPDAADSLHTFGLSPEQAAERNARLTGEDDDLDAIDRVCSGLMTAAEFAEQ